MQIKLKNKGFLCFVVFFGSGLVFLFLIFLMYQLGFRITYAPDLENNWDAISGTASWVSVIVSVLGVIASFFAVWSAIQVPKKIAELQIKVDLFEKRYRVYRTLILCDSFSALVSISTGLADIEIFFINLFVISLKNQRCTSTSFLQLNMYKLPKLWLKANFYFQKIFGKVYVK